MPNQPANLPTSEDIESKIKAAVDNNATNNPHPSVDLDTGKMAVVGDATEIETPNYAYKIEFQYTEDMLSEEDKKSCKKDGDYYFLTLTYTGKRVKPIYRTKVVLILTRVLADALIIDADGYSSDYVEQTATLKVLDDHLDDILDMAVMVLGVSRDQLEYMTLPSLADFFASLIKNEPNIIEECVRFLARSQSSSEKTPAENK